MKIIKIFLTFIFCLFSFNAYAKEIAILYTGSTHAMLYTCSCPIETDGGVSRRAGLIGQIRKNYPEALVLDNGNFFGGGLLDEHTQNTQLDTERTLINLKAMELMKYDAVAVGPDEFNFGKDFLQENINKSGLKFLSCNAKLEKTLPFIIKEVSGVKIGIIGLTTPAAGQKAVEIKISDPKPAIEAALSELKKSGADIVVLLSNLGEAADMELISDVKGIDILITLPGNSRGEPLKKKGSTLILRPSWQGRHLGKLTFEVKNKAVSNEKIEDLRLSDKVPGDKEIQAILPRCFSDTDCKKESIIGACANPGTLKSSCSFPIIRKVKLSIIVPKECLTCNTATVIDFLKKEFPGLEVSYIYWPEKKAKKLVADFNIFGLPAYLLGKEADKEINFPNLKENFTKAGDYYLVKPEVGGIAYFQQRKNIKGKLDLFLSLYDKNAQQLLDAVKDLNSQLHFVVVEKQGSFEAPIGGQMEVEDSLRGVCVQKYYPGKFFDYLRCRAKNVNSSWWEDCATGIDTAKIASCAKGAEGAALLKENINLSRELRVMASPVYLLENQEIFSTSGVPTKEELKKILKR